MVVMIRSRLGRWRAAVVPLVVCALALLAWTHPALAQKRGRSSRVSKYNAAMKQHEIASLQKQLDGSRKLLEAVTAKGAMSQAQLNAARSSAESAREALHAAVKQDNEINKKLRGIEDGILDAQSDDSEYAKALDAIHTIQRAQCAVLRQILKRPPPPDDLDESTRLSELAHLSTEERATLAADSRYTTQQDALHLAMDKLIEIKTKLFEASDEWKKAHEERHRIEQEEGRKELSIQGAANDSSDSRKELRTVAQIAASARASIAYAEARLRTLGAKPNAPTSDKKPATKKSTP